MRSDAAISRAMAVVSSERIAIFWTFGQTDAPMDVQRIDEILRSSFVRYAEATIFDDGRLMMPSVS